MSEWRAHLVEDWAMDGTRVYFSRLVGDERIEVITGFDEYGRPVTTSEPVAIASSFPGLLVPRGALRALAEAVKPGPSEREMARLEEALAVERGRVDSVLAERRAPG